MNGKDVSLNFWNTSKSQPKYLFKKNHSVANLVPSPNAKSSRRSFKFIIVVSVILNPFSANSTKWLNTLSNLPAVGKELFECDWPFCGVGV